MTRSIDICEVGARDGLQNEADVLPTATKLELIGRLIGAGVRRLEVASFVHPGRVPQMADAEAVVAALPDCADAYYIGLVLNMRGLDRAIATRERNKRGVDEAGLVVVASDTFGQRNQGQTVAEGVAETTAMIAHAHAQGMAASVTISAAFGCPFEGTVPPEQVVMIAHEAAQAGVDEIALADTIGVGVPAQVIDLFGRVREAVGPAMRLRAHFHDTRSTGIANAWAALEAGVETLDSSIGGLGGCPFAPRAGGNIATEDLVYLLDHSGVAHGLDLSALVATHRWLARELGRDLPSRVARAAL
jgi:hydroxymethylglutaryl-CoA lyase